MDDPPFHIADPEPKHHPFHVKRGDVIRNLSTGNTGYVTEVTTRGVDCFVRFADGLNCWVNSTDGYELVVSRDDVVAAVLAQLEDCVDEYHRAVIISSILGSRGGR